jgi:hypothetical protein
MLVFHFDLYGRKKGVSTICPLSLHQAPAYTRWEGPMWRRSPAQQGDRHRRQTIPLHTCTRYGSKREVENPLEKRLALKGFGSMNRFSESRA